MNRSAAITFTLPTRIVFGEGIIGSSIVAEVKALGIKKPLIVSDEGVVAAGIADLVTNPLADAGTPFAMFYAVPVEPDMTVVDAGLGIAKREACDGVIGVGGGSPLVAARAIAVLMTNPAPLRNYQGFDQVPISPAPVIAIPTTAGSGAEVSPSIPITDPEVGRRIVVRGRSIYPRLAILDPRAVESLPARLFIASGIDAFTHAVEALVSRAAHPITDALALEAATRMMRALPVAAFCDDLQARGEQLLSSTMAMLASGTVGLGMAHGVNNAIYALAREGRADRPLFPHGVLSGILLPHVMAFNLPVVADKYARLEMQWNPGTPDHDVDSMAAGAVARVRRLIAILGLPATVPWSDVTDDEIDRMVAIAQKTVQSKENPRYSNDHDLVNLIRACFGMDGRQAYGMDT